MSEVDATAGQAQVIRWGDDPAHRRNLLKAILAFSIISTTAHYTHNFVAIDQYPDDLVSGEVVRVAILLSWPLLTAVGLLGYRFYARGDYPPAYACLLFYSLLSLATVGHFLDGVPDIAPFWFATIFTDFLAGSALVAFTLWSARMTSRTVPATASIDPR